MFHLSSFDPWDFARPRMWYPMTAVEQQVMEFERLAEAMEASCLPGIEERFIAVPMTDDDFFGDLNMGDTTTSSSSSTKKTLAEGKDEKHEVASPSQLKGTKSFSSHSYSNAIVYDEEGRRVEIFRRRYEDSQGRLKAVHRRRMKDRVMTSTWLRRNKEDKGEFSQVCSSGDAQEFEKLWEATPFGLAAAEKQGKLGQEEEPVQEKEPQQKQKQEHLKP